MLCGLSYIGPHLPPLQELVDAVVGRIINTTIRDDEVIGEHRHQRVSGLVAHFVEVLRESYVTLQREQKLLDRLVN